MAKKPKQDDSEQIKSLTTALDFISQAQKKEGLPNQTHCKIADGWAIAYDGLLTIGHKVNEDLGACPNTLKLNAALKRCKDKFSITQLDEYKLTVKSGRFKASIDCLGLDSIAVTPPDPQCAVVSAALTDAMRAVVDCLVDSPASGRAFTGAALLQANSMVGTNGYLMVEYWHGIDLPPGILLPKKAIQAILKVKSELVGFGFSEGSVTFYFKDESFIKTQVYDERYPNYAAIFTDGLSYSEVSPDFYEAVNTVAQFSNNNLCYFIDGGLSSHNRVDEGAFLEGLNLPDSYAFNIGYLNAVKPFFEKVNFSNNKANFVGGSVRGVIMGINLE